MNSGVDPVRKKLLYVDDEHVNLYLFKALFDTSFDITTAQSAREGLSILAEGKEQFDAVITDLRMPEMDGLEFLKIMQEQYPKPRRFILTAYSSDELIQNAIKEGLAEQCFKKLMDTDEMMAQLKAVI